MNRIGLGFNPIFTVDKMVDLAVSAEKNGFESFWVHESIHQRDAISYLSSILSKTKKLKVGTGCINTVTRHPSLAATTFATLAEIYPKRIIMGIGWGGFPFLPKIGYKPFPTSQSKPLKRVTEYISIVNSLLTGENITFTGEFFTVNNMSLEIELKYKIPIYIASLSPKLLKRSSTLADGVILSPALSTPQETEKKIKWVTTTSKKPDFDVASYILTSINKNQREAEKSIRKFYFFLYQVCEIIPISTLETYDITEEKMKPTKDAWKKGDILEAGKNLPIETIDALTITGTADHCIDKLNLYRKIGVNLPILMPIGEITQAINAFGVKND